MSRKRQIQADKELTTALVDEHSSAKDVRSTMSKLCKRLDKRSKKNIPLDQFTDSLLDPYDLSSTTINNLNKRFKTPASSSGAVDYLLFIDHAVSLYIKGAEDAIEDLEEEDMEDDDDSSSSSRSRAARKNQKDGRKLTPTVDEDLLTELESNFSKQSVLVTKMMAAKDDITTNDLLSSTQFKNLLAECGIQLKPIQIREIFKSFGGGSSKKKLDFDEWLEYCQQLHPGKRPTNRRRSMRGSEIDQQADELRDMIKKHDDPDLIFDKFKKYDDLEYISSDQFYSFIRSIFKEDNLSRTEIKRLMDRFDQDDDGMISRQEFHEFLKNNSTRSATRGRGRGGGSDDGSSDGGSDGSDQDSDAENAVPNPGRALDRGLIAALVEAYDEDGDMFDELFGKQDRRNTGIVSSSKFKTVLTTLFKDTSLESRKRTDITTIIKAYGGSTSSLARNRDVKYKLFVQLCQGNTKNTRRSSPQRQSGARRGNPRNGRRNDPTTSDDDDDDDDGEKERPNVGARLPKNIRKKLAQAYTSTKRSTKTFDRMFRSLDKSGKGTVLSAKFKVALKGVLKDIGYTLLKDKEISIISRAYKGDGKTIDYEYFLQLCRGDYVKLPERRSVGDNVR